ncbi:oxidoreductase aryl-alcohol dehydrogenase like protein [Sphaerisporangium rufum]|uniref:Oxidoreductase aryl-alcohol dehydrogenase like protein n=1 Tax=Sphaerisporangium rufum TaxID=1381558 RepID=A0A919V784_9ACTN|nr:aldo/keto reductase [Sphaerisporangium rufum]GII80100.1 oxidoreductase aryl-alcohol dehydrogenase like protein [Sphaerisporangium rufum]
MQRNPLGSTGLAVTPLCAGASVLGGGGQEVFGYRVDAEQAVATLLEVFDSELNFLDTSNEYGDGESERRIGAAIRAHGGLPPGFVLATKVDPDPVTGDFSGDRVRTSVAESLERLGVTRVPLLYFHDPERIDFDQAMAPGGAVEALIALRAEGVVGHLGVAGGPVDLLRRYLGTGAFEVVITHNRFTLVDRSAGPLLDDAAARGVAVVNAAPYGGGMLVKGPDAQPRYAYRLASDATRDRVRAMAEACEAHGVPLAAAALQWSMRDERIASTIVGFSAPGRVSRTLELARWPIPDELWPALARSAAPEEDWLH